MKSADYNVDFRDPSKVKKREEKTASSHRVSAGEIEGGEFAAARAARDERKLARKADVKARALEHMPEPAATADGKRKINYEIEKHRGLTRKRKKIEGNARVNNRQKYESMVKRRKGAVREMREATDNYSGEATGVRGYVKKSTSLS